MWLLLSTLPRINTRADTREQQREWWRARLELDDRLAVLLAHLGSSWLGPWRCLLSGMPGSQTTAAVNATAKAFARQLLELAPPVANRPSPLQESLLAAAAVVLLHGAARGTISAADLEQAVQQLSTVLGSRGLGAADTKALAAQLANGGAQAAAVKVAGSTASQVQQQQLEQQEQQEQQPLQTRKAMAKSVKFADEAAAEEKLSPAVVPAAAAAAAEPTKRGNTQGRRGAAGTSTSSRGRRSAAAGATIANLPGSIEVDGDDCSSPTTVGTAAATATEPPQTVVQGADLYCVFDALSLGDGAEPSTAALATQQPPTTSRPASKHRSRLRLMGAATPARAGPARRPEGGAAGGRERGGATAPRAPRPLSMSVAKTAPPPAARSATAAADEASQGSHGAAAPVLLVLDGALQALPWESVPRLSDGRLYRCPSLACAAASGARRRSSGAGGGEGSAAPDVDLGSTFYALNPSGDLASTQSAFQDWFARLAGWEVRGAEERGSVEGMPLTSARAHRLAATTCWCLQ